MIDAPVKGTSLDPSSSYYVNHSEMVVLGQKMPLYKKQVGGVHSAEHHEDL